MEDGAAHANDPLAIEADRIRATEHERLRALIAADIDAARPLHADDFELVTPAGRTYSKEAYLDAVGSGAIDYRVMELDSDIAVRLYGQAAVIRYRARLETMTRRGLFPLQGYWFTDIYEQRDGRWQVVWSQATRIDE